MSPSMSKKSWIRFALVILLTGGFLFFFARSVNWREVAGYLGDIDWRWVGPALLITPIHLFARGYRWKYLLHYEKKDVRFYNLWAGNAVGFMVTYIFPGRLGELVKPLYVARKENIRPGFVVGTVVVERIFDIFTMCFLLGFFLLGRPLFGAGIRVQAEGFSLLYLWGAIGLATATGLLIISLLFYYYKEKALAVAARLLKFLPKKIFDAVIHLLQEFTDGLKIFHNLGNFLIYLFLGLVVWLSIIFTYWIFLFAFRFRAPFVALVPYIFVTAVGASIPTPGMVGGYDYFSKMGLVYLLGMNPNQAVGYTTVIHAVQLVLNCLIGYIILWKEGLSMFQLKTLGQRTEP
jgi:glycosyltransferase 2 family protein